MQTNTLNLEITIFSFRYLDSVEDLACKDYPLVKLLRIISMQSLGQCLFNIYLYIDVPTVFSSNKGGKYGVGGGGGGVPSPAT